MKVFISWSGTRSRLLGEVLRQWLPAVLQRVQPYFTPDDTEKGTQWDNEIARELRESQVGLLCITRDNLNAPWMLFEAGALSKDLGRSRVCPILFGLDIADLSYPLAQFQSARFEKQEMHRIMTMINQAIGDAALPVNVLNDVFEMWWPRLNERVQQALTETPPFDNSAIRSERDLLEEILGLVRKGSTGLTRQEISLDLVDLVISYQSLVTAAALSDAPVAITRQVYNMNVPLRELLDRYGTKRQMLDIVKLVEEMESWGAAKEPADESEIPF